MDYEEFEALCHDIATEIDYQIDYLDRDSFGLTEGGYLNHAVHILNFGKAIFLSFNVMQSPAFCIEFMDLFRHKLGDRGNILKVASDFYENKNGVFFKGFEARLVYEMELSSFNKSTSKLNFNVINWDLDILNYDPERKRVWH